MEVFGYRILIVTPNNNNSQFQTSQPYTLDSTLTTDSQL
jgi:hypothetical protein